MRIPRRIVFVPGADTSTVLSVMPSMDFHRSGPAKAAYAAARANIARFLSKERSAESGLPPVCAPRRRRYLMLLILVGFGLATAAGVGGWLFSYSLTPSGAGVRGLLIVVLIAAAATVGLLSMAERVLVEGLSQDYVHEIRMGLVGESLSDGGPETLGTVVARTTNDLTVVKNWISKGVAPLVVGIPLIIGLGVALVLLDPLLLVALAVPIILLVTTLRVLAPVVYERRGMVRRQRGRLDSQVSDTLLSAEAIRSVGDAEREMQRIDTDSQGLVAASIERAKVVGSMRGILAATSGIAAAMAMGIGLLASIPTHRIAGALAMAAFLATPLHNLGRLVEHRQNARVAGRMTGPTVDRAVDSILERVKVTEHPCADVRGAVAAAYLELTDGTTMAELTTRAGARVVVDAGNENLTSEVLERFVALRAGLAGEIVVGGKNLAVAGPVEFRQLVGYAARGMVVRRGSVSQAVRYRSPNSDQEEVDRLLGEVELTDRVAELTQGVDTVLVRGGEPLTLAERARLLLAGAMLDDPPLLVFDHLDAGLGTAGRLIMRRLLADYPGVVILASDDPEQIITPTHIWRPDGVQTVSPS